jgi:hypothetical protein
MTKRLGIDIRQAPSESTLAAEFADILRDLGPVRVTTHKPTAAEIALHQARLNLLASQVGCPLGIEPHFNSHYTRSSKDQ